MLRLVLVIAGFLSATPGWAYVCNTLAGRIEWIRLNNEPPAFAFKSGGRYGGGQRVGERGKWGGVYHSEVEKNGAVVRAVEKVIENSRPFSSQEAAAHREVSTWLAIEAGEKGYGPKVLGFRDVRRNGEVKRLIYMEEVPFISAPSPLASIKSAERGTAHWRELVTVEQMKREFPSLPLVALDGARPRADWVAGAGAAEEMLRQMKMMVAVHPDYHAGNVLVGFVPDGDRLRIRITGVDWTHPSSTPAALESDLLDLSNAPPFP